MATTHDQAFIRQANLHSILKLLQDEQPISRKELIRKSGMSPTSITRIVTTLLDLSLVVEGQSSGGQGARGRKAIGLKTNPDGLYSLGFLVDTRFIRLNVHTFGGLTLYTDTAVFPEAVHAPEALAREALALYRRMPGTVLPAPANPGGIGVCLSGTVDSAQGLVLQSSHLRWQDVRLQAIFEEAFGIPAWIENDVRAALIGEKDRLDIPRQTDAAYLYLGDSGISTALTFDGRLVRGEQHAAGEVAHLVLTPGDLPCDCGQHGCLQLHLLEKYLVQRAAQTDATVRSIDGILAAHAQKAVWAEALLDDFQRHLLLMIGLLDSFCNPGRIILGGETACRLRGHLAGALPGHVMFSNDFSGAAVHGVSILAMQQAVLRRLAGAE